MTLRPTLRLIDGTFAYVFADGTVLPRVAGGDGSISTVELPAELADRLGDLAALEDGALGEFETELQAYLDDITDIEDGGEITDEVIAQATAARDAINAVRADAERRFTEAEAAATEAAERRAQLEAIRDEVAPEEEAEALESEEGDEAGDQEITEPPPTENDGGAEAEVSDAETETQPEAIAAGASQPLSHRPSISRVAARRRRSQQARQSTSDRPRASFVAATDLRDFAAGSPLDQEQVAEAIVSRAMALRNVRPGADGMTYPVARAVVEYPAERRLSQMNLAENEERLDAAMGSSNRRGIAASGGVCAPFMPDFTQVGISDDSRPARGSLANFQADRGGVIHMAPPRFHRGLTAAELAEDSAAHDFSGAVGQWTQDNDVALNNPSTKPIMRVDCEEQVTDKMYFVTQRLEIGNFFNMTFQERVRAIIDVLNAEHASLGERLLLGTVAAGSKHISGTQLGGAASDILSHLDTMVAGYENRWRMPENHPPLQLWLPDWVHDLIRADRVRTLTAGTTDERFAYTDAQIDAWFDARNVNVTWLMDGETGSGQDFAAQADNAGIEPWPSHVIGYMFHSGGWAFMDGGSIDLGIIRDSVLAATNDLQMFKETLEGAFFRGWESLRFDLDVCPSGLSQGTASIDYCTTGS